MLHFCFIYFNFELIVSSSFSNSSISAWRVSLFLFNSLVIPLIAISISSIWAWIADFSFSLNTPSAAFCSCNSRELFFNSSILFCDSEKLFLTLNSLISSRILCFLSSNSFFSSGCSSQYFFLKSSLILPFRTITVELRLSILGKYF